MQKWNEWALHTGADILFSSGIKIHQPTLKELSEELSEDEFIKSLHLLLLSKDDIKSNDPRIQNLSNFELFLGTLANPQMQQEDLQNVEKLIQLIFRPNKVIFSNIGIYVSNTEQTTYLNIDKTNFDDLQFIVQKIFCGNKLLNKEQDQYNVVGEKAKEIAEKLKQRHQKLAELQSKENDGKSIFGNYASILSVGLKMPISVINNEFTLFQLLIEMERFSLYTEWNIDLKCRLAGGSPDKTPENWMKNI